MSQSSSNVQKKTFSHQWTLEKLASQDRKSVQVIRDRALRHGITDLVQLCEESLAARPAASSRSNRVNAPRHTSSDLVIGYHFVCARDRGVTEAGNGSFRSGSWVVAESNVVKSIAHGAYLALHESRSEPSYRQGKIVGYRRSPRDMVPEGDAGDLPQNEEGIEFFVEETSESYEWVGGGAGEKGYRWAEADLEQDSTSEPEGLKT